MNEKDKNAGLGIQATRPLEDEDMPPKKVWKSPAVILATSTSRAEKTSSPVPDIHYPTSISGGES
jgi:hypothetical protein